MKEKNGNENENEKIELQENKENCTDVTVPMTISEPNQNYDGVWINPQYRQTYYSTTESFWDFCEYTDAYDIMSYIYYITVILCVFVFFVVLYFYYQRINK